MQSRNLCLALGIAASIATFGCSKEKGKNQQPTRILQGANDVAGNDAKKIPLELSAPEPELDIVASVGNCAPQHKNELAVASCYKDVPCRGQFARSEKGGAVECWCYSQKGGCGEGTICCSASRKCEKPENCYIP
jgi:hypothetical protein